MPKDLIAQSTIIVQAPKARVWKALLDPDDIRAYMFGTEVTTDWKVGSPILWKGVWQGKPYEDRGQVMTIETETLVSYSHFSAAGGRPDVPENHHLVTLRLEEAPGGTQVTLTQDNNADEAARQHSEKNWNAMLESLKAHLEASPEA